MTIISFLCLSYILGVVAGYCGIFAALFEKDLSGLFKEMTEVNVSKYCNGTVLVISLMLVPLWPLLLLRPIFNWLKRPCQ